jgi:hypothetical protein
MKSSQALASNLICLPALIYFIVGLTAILFDMSHFANRIQKTASQFYFICIKIIVVFIVTLVINAICRMGYIIVASLITLATSLYLINGIYSVMHEEQTMHPHYYLPSPEKKPVFMTEPPKKEGPTVISNSMGQNSVKSPTQMRMMQILPPEQVIGLNGRL